MITLKENMTSQPQVFVAEQIQKVIEKMGLTGCSFSMQGWNRIVLKLDYSHHPVEGFGSQLEFIKSELKSALRGKLDKWGWFISEDNKVPDDYIQFETNTGIKAFLKKDVPKYLYHVTPQVYALKCIKQGIKPRNTWSKYGRVYLATSIHAAYQIADCFFIDGTKEYSDEEYEYLQIDTTKFTANYYLDPDFDRGVWTPTHIPPEAISLVG